jgi:hypothetical protein
VAEVPLRRCRPQRVIRGLGGPHGPVGHQQRQVQPTNPLAEGPHQEVEIGRQPERLPTLLHLVGAPEQPGRLLDIQDQAGQQRAGGRVAGR